MGFSLLQGPHQDAQKSIKTIFPFREDNFIFFSFGSLNSSSGAIFPISNPVVFWPWTDIRPINILSIINFKVLIIEFCTIIIPN